MGRTGAVAEKVRRVALDASFVGATDPERGGGDADGGSEDQPSGAA